ncbi:MAG: hypothetical protein II516_09935, partial [Treponema sp.]|nr:hypothetical protein [Treponema sp.]
MPYINALGSEIQAWESVLCSAPRQIRLKTRGVAEYEIKLAARLEATLPGTFRSNAGFQPDFPSAA